MKKLMIYLSLAAFFAPYLLAMRQQKEAASYRAPAKPSPNWVQHGSWEEQFPHVEPMNVESQRETEISQEYYKTQPTTVDWVQHGAWKN